MSGDGLRAALKEWLRGTRCDPDEAELETLYRRVLVALAEREGTAAVSASSWRHAKTCDNERDGVSPCSCGLDSYRAGTAAVSEDERKNPPTICKCGSAESYHQPQDKRDHAYEPRYEPEAWREGYRAALAAEDAT